MRNEERDESQLVNKLLDSGPTSRSLESCCLLNTGCLAERSDWVTQIDCHLIVTGCRML